MTKNKKGFSIVELLITISILTIVAAIAIPNLLKYKKQYDHEHYASLVEYSLKLARIEAMEKTRNIGICVTTNALTLKFDTSNRRDIAPCSANRTLRTWEIKDGNTLAGFSFTIDPRGIVIEPVNENSNICVLSAARNTSWRIYKTSIIKRENTNLC